MKKFLEASEDKSTLDSIIEKTLQWVSTEGLKIVLGIIGLIIVFKLINFLSRRLKTILNKKRFDKTLETVVVGSVRTLLKLLAFTVFVSYLGFETSSIAAIITSLGVGIGLALQGSLANLAGGIIILIMRPFKIGDYIESNGMSGTVEEIKMFYTYIVTPDNKVILIPNGSVANGTIVNYSTKNTRRVDLTFEISYADDFAKAKDVILSCIKKENLILEEPNPFINISSHGRGSINIITRVWCQASDYWAIHFNMLESVKRAFEENNITIPYPQLVVHINKE